MFYDRFVELCGKKNISLSKAAMEAGISKSLVTKWKNNNTETPSPEVLSKLSKYFGITVAELLGEAPAIPNAVNIFPMPKMKQWPVLGGTACGEPLFKPLEEESVWAPEGINADFVLQCIGDSMIGAHIMDGDTVFVKRGVEVADGQIAVVRIEDEYTLKRIYHGTDYLELRSENPKYPPIVIRGEQINAEIVGRAVFVLTRVI